jgi:hypothetical protein
MIALLAPLKFLAPRCQEFRNLRKLFYLLLCSLTPQHAAGNARAIVFKQTTPETKDRGTAQHCHGNEWDI